jgi:hypothetical protein
MLFVLKVGLKRIKQVQLDVVLQGVVLRDLEPGQSRAN